MTAAFHILGDPAAPILIVADHASSHVPDGIDLGLPPEVMREHVALDIGVAEVAALLVETGQYCAVLGGVSRLVIDYNREPDTAGLVPVQSDGHHIEGNSVAEVAQRLALYLRTLPCRGRSADSSGAPASSSCRCIASRRACGVRPDEARPWEIGILWNDDDRAPRIAIPCWRPRAWWWARTSPIRARFSMRR